MIIDRKRQKRAVMIRLENVCFAYEKEIALRYVELSKDLTDVENQH